MSSLQLPKGLEIAEIKSEKLTPKENFIEYLEFTENKINQICQEVLVNIINALGNNKQVNLIVPLNGGLIFYRKLMMLFEENMFYANAINVVFSDDDTDGSVKFSGDLVDVENAYNLAIDDIWDRGHTGKSIINAMREFGDVSTLNYFAFCKKENSPLVNDGAVIANLESITVFPEEWLHAWGGMNSGKFKSAEQAYVAALERTSFLPLIPTGEKPEFDPGDPEALEQYIDLLTQSNLSVNGVIPIEVYNDVLFLEQNPDLQVRFDYLTKLHQKYLRLNMPETIEVEG